MTVSAGPMNEKNKDQSRLKYKILSFYPLIIRRLKPVFWVAWGCCLLSPAEVLSQSVGHVQNNYLFSVGLEDQDITCILQDQRGFLWLGTNDGLYRYDGYTFQAYRHDPNDVNTLSNNNIRDLYEDKAGNLWIGTYGGGINVLDQDRRTFTHHYHDPEDTTSLSFDEIMVFFEDSRGRLWIGTDGGGVNRYLWEENSFVRFQHQQDDASSLSHNNVLSLFEDNEGYLWVGTWYGLNRMDTQTGDCLRFHHDPADPQTLSGNDIWSIYEVAPHQFWIGLSGGGIDVLNTQTGKVKRNPWKSETADAGEMVRILSAHNERLGGTPQVWVGGSTGLRLADPKTQTVITHFQHAATAERAAVLSLEESKTGMVWVGTTNGLYKLDPNNKDFHFHQFFPPDSAGNLTNTLYQDSTGIFWIGTPSGLVRYTPTTGQQQLFVPEGNAYVQSFYADPRGFFWIGTPGGLYRFYPQQQRFEPFVSEKFQSVSSRNISELYVDSKGRVWVGTILGMNKITFTGQGPQVVRYENDPDDPHSLVYSHHTSVVLEDSEGTLWIGTNGGGISRFDPEQEKFTRYLYDVDDPESLSNNFVECMYEDASGTLWIGTRAGLNKLDKRTGKFQRYTTANGLTNYWINTLLGDAEGHLWMSTQGGISTFDPQQQTFTNYDTGDGLITDVFISKAGWEGKNGILYFGSNRGMFSFHPDSIQKNLQIPPVILIEFSLFNQPVTLGEDSPLQKDISRTDSIELTYRQSSFSFDYVALNYTNSKKNQYAYQLQGFDPDWNYVGNGRKATYTNVKPGNYIFRVKASNNEGIWNETGTQVYITVLPPFWQTTWAYGVYLLLVMATLYGIYRYFLNRERSKSQLALERLQMTQAHELNQLKIRFFTHISHEIRTPLTLILSPIEKMLASAEKDGMPWKKQLERVHRNAQRLQNLVNQLMDFRKIESGSLRLEPAHGDLVVFAQNVFDAFAHLAAERQITYRFFSSKDKIWASFDADKLEKILNNLLSNALKYTPEGGEVTLEITIKEHKHDASVHQPEPVAMIRVKDSGIGIPAEEIPHIFDPFYQARQTNSYKQAGSGIGLALTRELVKLHRGNVTLQSQPGYGTTVTVELPLMQASAHAAQSAAFSVPENTSTEEALSAKQPKEKSSSKDTSQSLLLVVDDNPDIRHFIRENFSDQYRIREAENGKIALKEAIHRVPDVVVSDVLMPVMDGITFCKKLRTDERTSHVPVILLTASHSETNRLRALSIGADDYIHKPFNIFLLKARVQNLLEMRQQLRKRFSREVRLQPKDVTVSDVDEKFLQRLMDVVEASMGDSDFNVNVMCKKTGISRPQLYRKLQALTGQSVHEFIRTVRLKRAAQLLETGQLSIAEVAYQVGFNDPHYFSRCFKKQFGVSPSKVSA